MISHNVISSKDHFCKLVIFVSCSYFMTLKIWGLYRVSHTWRDFENYTIFWKLKNTISYRENKFSAQEYFWFLQTSKSSKFFSKALEGVSSILQFWQSVKTREFDEYLREQIFSCFLKFSTLSKVYSIYGGILPGVLGLINEIQLFFGYCRLTGLASWWA